MAGGVILGVVVVGTLGMLLTAPDAKPTNAGDVFDTPEAGDGAVCFRASSPGDPDGFVASIDASSPDRTTRYFKSGASVTRVDYYANNRTTVTVHNFVGDDAESRYQGRLNRIESDEEENRTVVTDDENYRIQVVETNTSYTGTKELNILVPALSVVRWEQVNESAYRPVGGYVESKQFGDENVTTYVSSAAGLARTDGNGSLEHVNFPYRAIDDVDYRIEPMFKDGTPVTVSFEREACAPTPVRPPEGYLAP